MRSPALISSIIVLNSPIKIQKIIKRRINMKIKSIKADFPKLINDRKDKKQF